MRRLHGWVCLSGALVGGCGLSIDLDRFSFESAIVPPDAAGLEDASAPKDAAAPEDPGELDGSRDVGSSPSVLVASFDHYWFNRGQPPYSVTEEGRGLLSNDEGPRVHAGELETRYGGTVALDADGTFRYEPAGGAQFWGDDSFEYTQTDDGDEATARVRLTVNPNTVRLSELDALRRGRVIQRTGGNGVLAAAFAGDVNGEGKADLVVTMAVPSGAAARCVLFGEKILDPSVDPSGCASVGFAVTGGFTGQPALASAGDVDGDGFDDVLIGNMNATGGDNGAAYVVFGKADPAEVDLEALGMGDSERGFVISGAAASDFLGSAVAPCGDFNGDGFDDFVVGAPGVDTAGAVYVVLGAQRGTGNIALADGTAARVIVINGSEGDGTATVGTTVAGAGDVNGDGLDDVVIGSPDSNRGGTLTGAVYVVFGKTDRQAVSLRQFENGVAAGGFVRYGRQNGAHAGATVAGVGDFDGDGLDDFAYAAPGQSGPAPIAGIVSVVFGLERDSGVEISYVQEGSEPEGSLDITGISPAAGSIIILGRAGDQNGDGIDDLLLAVPADDSERGVMVSVLGSPIAGEQRLDRSLLAIRDGRDRGGTAFEGANIGDRAGTSVVGGGDIDGDGLDDALVTTGRDVTAENRSYVLLGWDMRDSLGDRDGSFVGTYQGEQYSLVGSVVRLSGGNGVDTITVRDQALLDLTLATPSLIGIEKIDLSGGGPTVLRLDDAALRRLPQTRRDVASAVRKVLDVIGDADDVIEWLGSPPCFEPELLQGDIQKRLGARYYGIRIGGAIASEQPCSEP